MNEKLTELKIKWSNHIAWGKLYGCLSPDQKILQLAWKDSQIVLFMTTVVDARTTIPRVRKRPNGADKWMKAEFRDQAFKSLNIPEFIDMYNHFMNGVDRADQIRTYYRTNRRNYRTWKPLWNYLFQTTICNASLIWDGPRSFNKEEGRAFEVSYEACLPTDGSFILFQTSETISLRAETAVMVHTMSYLKVRRNVRPVWLKVVRLKQVGKERFFKSFQNSPYGLIRTEKVKKTSTTANQIWLFGMSDSSLSGRNLLRRAYSIIKA
ncbi:hypothetical protein MPH_13594 [Macrophomina phaseolina MS6]|uniref:PiggyBac transposable element-derived protein domain-containing protein n=1 Tax=Macrophomina phaseolina (strain MS6) TaxID=1126212 RepID=K2R5A1_MACPH|nr:hypothetical protein MPH_13594 [Macrophomina phaseolina MS6]